MKERYLKMSFAGTLIILSIMSVTSAFGESATLDQKGNVTVDDSGKTEIVDPEKPEEVIEPGPSPSTSGSLRIDYVSSLDFGKVKVTETNRVYPTLANKVGTEGKLRGTFIQVSDFREKRTGWSLQVKQETQFKTDTYDELTGAVLSLDKGWANSSSSNNSPSVTRDTLAINNIGQVYEVARADETSGAGVWTIAFGASKENDKNQPVTIENNQKSGKSVNQAVSLKVPDATKIVAKEYQTKMTWILSEAP
ncbi:WxL domain-containing protein [Vagococcus hydrophili]|nr:WxL domain-containing protein [Vagococcus hydrophili]